VVAALVMTGASAAPTVSVRRPVVYAEGVTGGDVDLVGAGGGGRLPVINPSAVLTVRPGARPVAASCSGSSVPVIW